MKKQIIKPHYQNLLSDIKNWMSIPMSPLEFITPSGTEVSISSWTTVELFFAISNKQLPV